MAAAAVAAWPRAAGLGQRFVDDRHRGRPDAEAHDGAARPQAARGDDVR